MLQLRIRSGKAAGTEWIAHHFPVRIGRAANADLRLEDEGVWDSHLEIDLRPGEGFFLSVTPGAYACINSQPTEHSLLRNGDQIELGAARLQFALTPTRSRALRWREVLTWVVIALLCLGQVALVYWLPD